MSPSDEQGRGLTLRQQRWAVTVGSIAVAWGHILWPTAIDGVTFALLVVAALPWLSGIIKAVEVPGAGRIELAQLESAGQKITAGTTTLTPSASLPRPAYLEIVDRDPNLAVVGLGIEIEKRVRELAQRAAIEERLPFPRLVDELARREIVRPNVRGGLLELMRARNAAAHGRSVDPDAVDWSMSNGPEILASLDMLLNSGVAERSRVGD